MTRSYKKNPIVKAKCRKEHKISNRKVRRINKVLSCYYEDLENYRATHEHITNGQQQYRLTNNHDVTAFDTYYSEEMWRRDTEGKRKCIEDGHERRSSYLTEQAWKKRFGRK